MGERSLCPEPELSETGGSPCWGNNVEGVLWEHISYTANKPSQKRMKGEQSDLSI